MYKFSTQISDTKKFNTVLGKGDSAFLSVYLTGGYCFMVNEQSGIISAGKFRIINSSNLDNSVVNYFRIDKKKILKLLMGHGINFLVEERYITISFLNEIGEEEYSYRFVRQQEDLTLFYKLSDAMRSSEDFKRDSFIGLDKAIKIAKNIRTSVTATGTTLCCSDGAVGVYRQFNSSNPFKISPFGLDACLSVSSSLRNTKAYLIAQEDDYLVIANKEPYVECDDIFFIKGLPSMCKVTFFSESLISLVNKLEVKEGNFILDFNNRTAKLLNGTNEFTVKFKVKEIKKSDKNADGSYRRVVLPKIVVPYYVLSRVLNPIKVNLISLYIKKNNILINTKIESQDVTVKESNAYVSKDDLSILFRRVDYSDEN